MKFNETINLNTNSFKDYDNAKVDYLELNKNGVILHYTKHDQKLSFGAVSIENMLKQWNGGLI